MPSLTEFLLAPWRILEFVGIGAPSSAIPLQAGAAPTSLCYRQDIGGQILHICRVSGYEMPSFVFWASLFIFTLFLLSSSGLIQQCARVALSLNRISAKLSKHLGKRATSRITPEELAAIRNAMAAEPLAATSWHSFEETLLISQDESQVYSTSPLEASMSRSFLIDENVHGAFFATVPGILTGLGLLMTFIAILDGLSHVSVTANMDVKGIGGLINGLSGKFVSSIVAVLCAVSFVFVERIAYAQPQAAYRRLMNLLAPRFQRRTAEHLLFSLETQMRAQAAIQVDLAHVLGELRRNGASPKRGG